MRRPALPERWATRARVMPSVSGRSHAAACRKARPARVGRFAPARVVPSPDGSFSGSIWEFMGRNGGPPFHTIFRVFSMAKYIYGISDWPDCTKTRSYRAQSRAMAPSVPQKLVDFHEFPWHPFSHDEGRDEGATKNPEQGSHKKSGFIQAPRFHREREIRCAGEQTSPRWRAQPDTPATGRGRRIGLWQQLDPPFS